MKYYKLSAVIEGQEIVFKKHFDSRNAAINHAFKSLPFGSQVEEEIIREDKHDIEYRCNHGNIFFIRRKIA